MHRLSLTDCLDCSPPHIRTVFASFIPSSFKLLTATSVSQHACLVFLPVYCDGSLDRSETLCPTGLVFPQVPCTGAFTRNGLLFFILLHRRTPCFPFKDEWPAPPLRHSALDDMRHRFSQRPCYNSHYMRCKCTLG